ncbi:hypothetical protein MNBD_NITROSPINAE03-486 [hydrothermal vent metagenome]|uniref:DUF1330 domain-containing protein n=2 Tax=hydrothermal vent metagenome TaxID=652676 RepID=A0A3B1BNI4_9ZZZZ
MKNLLISVIAIFLLGGCAHHKSTHVPTDRLYVVVDVDITDVEKYDRFLALEAPILKKFDSYVAMDIRSEDQKKRYIIVSFPDSETLDKFVKSAEFQKILPLNKESAKSKIFHGHQHGG